MRALWGKTCVNTEISILALNLWILADGFGRPLDGIPPRSPCLAGSNGPPNLKVSPPKLKFRCFRWQGLLWAWNFFLTYLRHLSEFLREILRAYSSRYPLKLLFISCARMLTQFDAATKLKFSVRVGRGSLWGRILFLQYLRQWLKFLQETLRASKAIIASQSLSHIICKNFGKLWRSSEIKISWFEFGRAHCGRGLSFWNISIIRRDFLTKLLRSSSNTLFSRPVQLVCEVRPSVYWTSG